MLSNRHCTKCWYGNQQNGKAFCHHGTYSLGGTINNHTICDKKKIQLGNGVKNDLHVVDGLFLVGWTKNESVVFTQGWMTSVCWKGSCHSSLKF